MQLSFMSAADHKFFDSLKLSIAQVERFHPDAAFYVYDWGLTAEQVAVLSEIAQVDVIDWKSELIEFDAVKQTDWSAVFACRDPSPGVVTRIRRQLAKRLPIATFLQRHASFESLICNTPLCILDCLRRHDGPLVYLDGDALLTAPIDEVFTDDYDVGVTVRRMAELDFSHNRCNVINTGVLFFRGDRERSVAFVRQWLDRIEKTREYIVVQTALVRLIADDAPRIFEGYRRVGTMTSGAAPVRVKSFPCDEYNFIWVEEGVDTATTKIVHFKGQRHSPRTFQRLLRTIDV